MRGIRAVVMAAALIALVPGSGLAQERRPEAGADKRVQEKKTVKKKPAKKRKRTKKVSKTRGPVSPGNGALAKRTTAAADEVEFLVKTSPRGATITIDGVSFGSSPVKVHTRTGRRVVSAELAGHAKAATTIQVDEGLGYIVFSLAREPARGNVADKQSPAPKSKGTGFGTKGLKHSDAIQKARMSLKGADYAAALRYAAAALASKAGDQEAMMIATIASCGVGDEVGAKRHLPRKRGSYREISIKRCGRLGVELP